MTIRYAYIVNGKTEWGPGPNPYYLTLKNGDIWEVSAHTVEESESIGVFVVDQIDKKDVDERFFAANLPVYSVINGRPRETWSYSFIPAARENMLAAIDEHAENVRKFITTKYPGQYAEYDEVYKEALDVQSLPSEQEILPGTYPYLEADINVTFSDTLNRYVQTVREAADVVILTRNAWKNYGIEIRTRRLKAKKDIRDAVTVEDAYEAYIRSLTDPDGENI